MQDNKKSEDEGGDSTASIPHELLSVNRQSTFPEQLMEVLSNESLSDIITWLPHGNGWIIRDKKCFEREVIPNYFGTAKSKYTSFTRKLNRWNFHRISSGVESGAYYHPLFRRDDPKLCSQMTCFRHVAEPVLDPAALGLATPKMVEQGMLASILTRGAPSLPVHLGVNPTLPLHLATSAATTNATHNQGTARGNSTVPVHNLRQTQLPIPYTSPSASQATRSFAPGMSSSTSQMQQQLQILQLRQNLDQALREAHIRQEGGLRVDSHGDFVPRGLMSKADGTISGLSNVDPDELPTLLAQMRDTQRQQYESQQQVPGKYMPQRSNTQAGTNIERTFYMASSGNQGFPMTNTRIPPATMTPSSSRASDVSMTFSGVGSATDTRSVSTTSAGEENKKSTLMARNQDFPKHFTNTVPSMFLHNNFAYMPAAVVDQQNRSAEQSSTQPSVYSPFLQDYQPQRPREGEQ